jgi:cyclopropane-fatty-acyl-phospholipid synthase
LNQGIATHEHFKPGIDFIARYIFPDGQCAQLYTYLKAAQESGWEIVDVEAWRPHYAKTLRCWAANLEAAGQTAQALVGGRRYLLWQLYLTLCAQGFERGRTGIYQVLMRRAEDADWNLPLVRNGWLY